MEGSYGGGALDGHCARGEREGPQPGGRAGERQANQAAAGRGRTVQPRQAEGEGSAGSQKAWFAVGLVGLHSWFLQVFCGRHFFLVLFSILLRFGEVLGGPSGVENRTLISFWRCFFRVRLGIDFLVIF